MEVEEINNKKGKEERKGTGAGIGTNNGINTGVETKDREQEQFRVVINKEASFLLDQMHCQVQDGFDGGEVTKSDVANWLIRAASESFGDHEVKIIRHLYFDERKILASLLKISKNENLLPETLRKAIREIAGLSDVTKKRSAKETPPVQLPIKTERTTA